jgi:hypothetical protein
VKSEGIFESRKSFGAGCLERHAEMTLQRGDCARGCVGKTFFEASVALDFPFDVH